MLCAIFAGDAKILRILLDRRADPNYKLQGLSDLGYFDGQTLLMAATKSGQEPSILTALLELRADVNATTRIGLPCVALVRSPGQVTALMAARADLHSPGIPFGLTPIAGACVWACPETIATMLAARCDPNFTPRGIGYGPLHALCLQARTAGRSSALEVAKVLIAGRADVNARAEPVGLFKFACLGAQARASLRGGLGSCSWARVAEACSLPPGFVVCPAMPDHCIYIYILIG